MTAEQVARFVLGEIETRAPDARPMFVQQIRDLINQRYCERCGDSLDRKPCRCNKIENEGSWQQ
jgi:hypothetical protein